MSVSWGGKLEMWVLYKNPTDFPPGTYVARLHTLNGPSLRYMKETDLTVLREKLMKKCLVKIERMEKDDPCIVEVWL